MKAVAIFVSIVLLAAVSSGLDFRGIEEFYSCDSITVDPNLTQEWMAAVNIWYIPIWNKVDLYQNAIDFFGPEKFAEMTVEDLDKTCVYYKINGTHIPIYGFEDQLLEYESFPDPVRKGIQHWTHKKEYHATTFVTRTDNKTYFFAVTFWASGMKGFNVGASIPKLDEVTLMELKQHAMDLGFDPKQFSEQDYTKCPPPPASISVKSKQDL